MESATCNKCFSSDYMLLNPDEAGFLDLAKVLFSSNLEKRKFVDCPDGAHEPSFGRRWIIFVSVVVQKMLKMVAKPLAGFGSGIEHWLNLLSGNGGFFGLAANYLKGKVVRPDRTSANFLSFIGCIDKRRELDPTISHVDCRYYAALSVMAAKASYENHQYIQSIVNDQWEMEYLGSFDFWNDYQEKATTQAFALQDNNDVVIASFRGTETFDSDAWSTDADISWYDLPTAGKIHGGFLKSLGLQKSQGWPREQDHHKPPTAYYAIRKLLHEKLEQNSNSKFILTGHSLGGALAVLFPAVLGLHGESSLLDRLEAVYTFGQPRVGDEKFKQYMESLMEKHNISYYRFVYSYDVVPRLPYDDSTLMFKHFGTCIYYNSFYEGKVVAEEPNKNYFSLIWLLPKIANACWELMRSFVIGYTRGKDYREGGLLRILRFAGLLVAGIPAHCPQDYVNSTRLGKPDVFLSAIGRENRKILKTN
ncbi:alpha/beta-Hydrolases superfamily protein [Striga hermonthica]|uniref:Alpha/beta-Hydrolases superfamily protein n=1 Tax=Striga hermonthica TaxID=68872 RepID=A0A9N7P0L1_STRHE|nr:alpha/beta-Hydrolases superfamily protein [Striga hermonthica]